MSKKKIFTLVSLGLFASTSNYAMKLDPEDPQKDHSQTTVSKEESDLRFQEVIKEFSFICDEYLKEYSEPKLATLLTNYNEQNPLSKEIPNLPLQHFNFDLLTHFLGDATNFNDDFAFEEWRNDLIESTRSKNLQYPKEIFEKSHFFNAYQGAQRLKQIADDQKLEALLFPGRSGDVVRHIMRNLYEKDNETVQMVNIPISGHPDVEIKNSCKDDPINGNSLRNLVKKNRLEAFFELCDYLKIHELTGKNLGVVDIVASGGAMNSFLKLLEGYFYVKGLEMPEITIISLGYLPHEAKRQAEECGSKPNHSEVMFTSDAEHIMFSLDNENFQLRHAKTLKKQDYPAFSLRIHPSTIDWFDDHFSQYFAGQCTSYPAYLWVSLWKNKKVLEGGICKDVMQATVDLLCKYFDPDLSEVSDESRSNIIMTYLLGATGVGSDIPVFVKHIRKITPEIADCAIENMRKKMKK